MTETFLSDRDLDTIFRSARSVKAFTDQPVSDITIRAIYDLMRWGPTSFNCAPARFVMVQSDEAKQKLADCAIDSNKDKILNAPVTAIIAQDLKFYEKLPDLYKALPTAADFFVNDAELASVTAFRNSSLQGAYLMIAARALGLDCCPMSGFDNAAVDEAFFAGTDVKSNFICALGHGDYDKLPEQDRRLSFDEACQIL